MFNVVFSSAVYHQQSHNTIHRPQYDTYHDTGLHWISPQKNLGKQLFIKHCMCNGADKTRGVRIHMQAFIDRYGQNTGRVEQMANRYIEGKANEYSSKQAWSTIGEQYPEGKAER